VPDWFPSDLAETALFTPLRVSFLIVMALLARLILRRVVDRVVRGSIGYSPRSRFRAAQVLVEATTVPRERREQRISALGSLARSVITLVIFAVTAMMILAEMGFNVTSIVAGTSVVAATLAFGMQNLIKDLVSGVFMLVEDQLGVGDWVDLDQAAGEVEEIGLRVTRLRGEGGTVWYVRNGEVLRVGNFSQGGPGRPEPAT
jgi:small conductance mechanosensitive channel